MKQYLLLYVAATFLLTPDLRNEQRCSIEGTMVEGNGSRDYLRAVANGVVSDATATATSFFDITSRIEHLPSATQRRLTLMLVRQLEAHARDPVATPDLVVRVWEAHIPRPHRVLREAARRRPDERSTTSRERQAIRSGKIVELFGMRLGAFELTVRKYGRSSRLDGTHAYGDALQRERT